MSSERQNAIFLLILFILVGLSVFVTYYRYIVQNDFFYFTTEESIPDRFAPASYSHI
ncbi:MAG: hypothetical protein WCW14_01875 [Candidatus Paceibacterota bacterium]